MSKEDEELNEKLYRGHKRTSMEILAECNKGIQEFLDFMKLPDDVLKKIQEDNERDAKLALQDDELKTDRTD